MVATHSRVRDTIPVTLEVTQQYQRSLGSPGGCSAIPEVIWACFLGGCLVGPVPTEVTNLGLVPQRCLLPWRLLAQACSRAGCSLIPAQVEVAGSYLLLQRSLGWVCSLGGCSLITAPAEVADLGLLPRRSLALKDPVYAGEETK